MKQKIQNIQNTAASGYNDIGLFDGLSVTSHIQWYQLITHC